MKISKTLLQTIAVTFSLAVTSSACTKEKLMALSTKTDVKKGKVPVKNGVSPIDNCLACGKG